MQQERRLNLKLVKCICTQLHIYQDLQPFKLMAIKIWKGFCAIFSRTIKPTESFQGPPSHRCNLALNEVPVTVPAVTSFESKPITSFFPWSLPSEGKQDHQEADKKVPSVLFYTAYLCCGDNVANHPWDKNELGITLSCSYIKRNEQNRPEEIMTFPQGNV